MLPILEQGPKVDNLGAQLNADLNHAVDKQRLLSSGATRATEGTEYDNFPQAQTMANFPPASHDLLSFDQLLSEEERDVKYRTRAYMVNKPSMQRADALSCPGLPT